MKNTNLTVIDTDSLNHVTGGRLFGGSHPPPTPGASGVQDDSKGLFHSLFGRRDPNALPSPLPNFRELLGG